ncbi:Sodium/glucose cotransporter [Posidoniimonas polymericola]|uniref:Sodium/glucose cotransporter n=1 Tax=Posidoniimonas polymericola TaxID=2528002 RepID=A0A5C5YTS6_9BACT|nr:sodium:solute symporter [Posidoniimonas polymericola]TWT78385.1 Sodium/glucose cotransporter [Posidoniimonas polymericola]
MHACQVLGAATTIDRALVVIYLVATLAIGLLASRGLRRTSASGRDLAAGTDSEDAYFLAGRRVPGWMNGVSFAATALNADVGPTYCGFAVVVGLPIAFFYLPRFALAWMIAALVFAVRWRQLQIRTGPEFYALRFSGSRTRFMRVYSSLFAIAVNMAPWIGAGLLGVHKVFGPAFGIEDKTTTLAIVLPVLVAYVWIGGFAGVVLTDVMQSLVILLASGMLVVSVLWEHGGPAGLAAAVENARPGSSAEILSTWPTWGHRVLGPAVVLAWLLVPTVGRGGAVDLEGQRLFSCRSDRDAAKMNVWGAAGLFAMLLLLTLPTLGLLVKHPWLYDADPGRREEAYSMLLSEYLPSGFFGIALSALLASVMSTISSHLSYGSQTLVNDVARQLSPDSRLLAPGSRSAVWVGRFLMLAVLAAGIMVAYHADSLIGIAIVLAGMYGATASIYWGQWWWWRVNFWSWLTAMIGGPCIFLTLGGFTALGRRIPGLLSLFPSWGAARSASESAAQGMDMLQAALGMALTCVAWILATLATSPEPMPVLVRFYRRARPMGLWGPVRERCLQEDDSFVPPPRNLLLRGLLAAVVGASTLVAGVLGASVWFVGRWAEGAVYLGTAVATGVWFARLFDRQMRLLGADQPEPRRAPDA